MYLSTFEFLFKTDFQTDISNKSKDGSNQSGVINSSDNDTRFWQAVLVILDLVDGPRYTTKRMKAS